MTLDVETYQDPGNLSHVESDYPPLTGCEKQVFKPVLLVNPTTTEADSPRASTSNSKRRSSSASPPRRRRSALPSSTWRRG